MATLSNAISMESLTHKVCCWGKGKPSKESEQGTKKWKGYANKHSQTCPNKCAVMTA
jgi:hypothetical protein